MRTQMEMIHEEDAQTLFQQARALEHANLISHELFIYIKNLIESRYDVKIIPSKEIYPQWMI